jgi:hypothetical protein
MLGRWIHIQLSHYCQNLAFLKWKLLLESYKSPGTDQIPSILIKAGVETLCSEIHKLICSNWNKE